MTTPAEKYEKNGLDRFMIIAKIDTRERLKNLAKKFKLMQGEIIDILIADLDEEAATAKFEAARLKKEANRATVSNTGLKKKLGEATPEQLAQIEAILTAKP